MTSSSTLDLNFEHVFDIKLFFDRRWALGPVPGGSRFGYTSVGEGGEIVGPRLNGKVVDYSGADWPTIRDDGVVDLLAHYMLEADDGTRIHVRNLGYVHGPIRSSGRDSNEPPDIAPYFRCTPYFRAPAGPHEWLNRTVIVGVAARKPRAMPDDEPDHSVFRYYAVL